MIEKVLNYFKKRPGLSILAVILGIITFANLKPDLYLAGWDNYSSYFNLKTNLFRTFFSTWRESRGLGVPSDSEVTDIFRQVFSLVLSPFVKEQLLDQIYAFFSLNLGVILVYFLAGKLYGMVNKEGQHKDLVGFISGFFYLFNLNTLATFYFPMIMFINRYYTIPLLVILMINFFEKKKLSVKEYLILAFSVIASSGSYLTATVFITVLIFLAIFIFFQSNNLKKSLVALVMFLALNSFWLFPFVNYTINRSGAVNLAPTFIEANEIQLNKPKSFYSFEKLLTLYPNFFDTPITSLDRQKETGYHPLVPLLDKFPYRQVLFLFPILYIIGSFYLVANFRKAKKILWIPATLFLFVFLSMKEFSPLGFIYIFLEESIPFFGNIFRFADTKFHYFIAFSGSLATGILLTALWEKFRKKSLGYPAIILFVLTVFVFKDYLTGHFFGFFERNAIPEAYFKIASVLNDDKSEGRVLQLPFDKNIYWRSYNWGYLGSSFLHFMIDRPLLEKTFEPGSEENARLNDEIFRSIANSQSATANNSQEEKTAEFYELLRKTGIKYLIYDTTISSEQPSKGITLWGRFNVSDSKQMIDNLENAGLITLVADHPVDLSQYLSPDGKVFPVDEITRMDVETNPYYSVRLYRISQSEPKFRVSREVVKSDSQLKYFSIGSKDYVQYGEGQYMTEPFKRKDAKYDIEGGNLSFALEDYSLSPGRLYTLDIDQQKARQAPQTQIKVFVRKDQENLTLSFYQVRFPDLVVEGGLLTNQTKLKEIAVPISRVSQSINESESLDRYFSNWQILPYKTINGLRLKIGKTTMPLPFQISDNESYVGSVLTADMVTPVQLLASDVEIKVDPESFKMTEKPNCYDDGLVGYESLLSVSGGRLNLDSRNGSTCFLTPLDEYMDHGNNYLETKIDYESDSEDLDRQFSLEYKNTSKPILRNKVLSMDKVNYLYACLRDVNLDDCFNLHSIISLNKADTIIIPAEKEISALNPIMFFALKNTAFQSQKLTIKSMSVVKYETVAAGEIEINPDDNRTITFEVDSVQPLEIGLDLPLSPFSFYQNSKDGFNISNGTCARPESYRTFRKDDRGRLVSYFENCDNSLFQILDFDSNNFYLWSVDYNSASGKYPRMVLGDGLFNYVDQYLSLWQGYPDVQGFKRFQHPEFFQTDSSVQKSYDGLALANTSITVPSNQGFYDYKRKNFTVSHNSENEGLAIVSNFNVVAVPNIWEGLTVNVDNNSMVSETQVGLEHKKILPSLHRVIISSDSSANQNLVFNEAYDTQWGIYSNVINLVLGKESSLKHNRCNGYANCFEVAPGSGDYYIFYQPERLYFLGWLVTLAAVFLGKRMLST